MSVYRPVALGRTRGALSPMTIFEHIVRSVSLAVLAAAAVSQRPLGQEAPPAGETLRFRYMGPESAGRISAVVGVPGDTSTYYAGAASGGVWKTNDGAKTFEPVFDDQPVQAIGAL